VENRQARTDFVREGEEVEFGAELAVVAALGFGKTVEVCREVGFRGPRRAVDPLQLLIGLVAAPVGGASCA
jgi:hypothetical protein